MTSVTERGRDAQVARELAGSDLPVPRDHPQRPGLVRREGPRRGHGGPSLSQPAGHPHDEVTEVGLGSSLGRGGRHPGMLAPVRCVGLIVR